jgi:hypothetical protein
MPQQYDGNDSQTKSVASDPRRGALFIDRSPIEELMATYRGVEMNWRGWAILEGVSNTRFILISLSFPQALPLSPRLISSWPA